MPNWCQNHLTVTGATPEFRAWLETERFSFEAMAPANDAPKETDPHQLQAARTNAWGTKWDIDENDQHRVAKDLIIGNAAFFDTAWDPPLAAIQALSRRFTGETFHLHFCELGMFFAGAATFHAGEDHEETFEDKTSVLKIASDIFGYEDEEPCELVD